MINDMIETIRGDTLSFNFELEFTDRPQELDAAHFTCKKNLDDDSPLFQKSIGDGIRLVSHEDSKLIYSVRVAPNDTRDLAAGQYHYDLQIELNGDVFTVLVGILQIQDDITR